MMLRKLVLKFPKQYGFLPHPRWHTGTLTCGLGDHDGRAPRNEHPTLEKPIMATEAVLGVMPAVHTNPRYTEV